MKARLTLKVRAGARRTAFVQQYGEAWKLQVAAPPVDGKANEAIVRFLAKFSSLPQASVRIVSGFTGSTKIVELDGIDPIALSLRVQRAILESNGHSPDTGSAEASEP